ncbi:hypothetical protein CFIMG_008127RA00001 [Ceratocystis fimbriata CBS 114723]|uniref:Uncharacterized protein n=1 Tax=Ceratocystis fimbriata CBS 114723 TaxID=1035309 RepID=A0A2C5XHZ4_9PEZI|nr:hypothetical protein CFIMG_008127RA00001 [Ceratocystis fimbriata CBS 114723]
MPRPFEKRNFVADCSSSLKYVYKKLGVAGRSSVLQSPSAPQNLHTALLYTATDSADMCWDYVDPLEANRSRGEGNTKATKQQYFCCPFYANAPHEHGSCLGNVICRESDVKQHIKRVHNENLPSSHQYQHNGFLEGPTQLPFPPIMLSFYHAVNAAVFIKLSAFLVKMSQDASIGLSPDSISTLLRTFALTDQASMESDIPFAIKLAYEISKEGLNITSESAIHKAYHMSGIDHENQPVCEKAPAFVEASGSYSNEDNQNFNVNLGQDALLAYSITTTATTQIEDVMTSSYNHHLQDKTNISLQAPDPFNWEGEHSSSISLQNAEYATQLEFSGDWNGNVSQAPEEITELLVAGDLVPLDPCEINAAQNETVHNFTAGMSQFNLGSNTTPLFATQDSSYHTYRYDILPQNSDFLDFTDFDTESGQWDSARYVGGI